MASVRILLYSALVVAGGFLLATSNAQTNARSLVSPSVVRNCYQNSTAFRRFQRQPMHIDNLIAIVRKIEEKNPYWDMRRVARTIVKGFQFDGMKFEAGARLEFAYTQLTQESVKTGIIHRNIPSADQPLEEWVIDNDERCALHWMLSHSMNATMRDDEEIERYGGYRSGGLRAKRASGPGVLDLETDDDPERAKRVVRQAVERTTRWPVETGVVYTKWGSISAGRVLAGIAAGLEPQSEQVVYAPMARDGGSSGGVGGVNSGGFPLNPTGFGAGGSYPGNSNPSGVFPGTGTGVNPGSSYQSLNPPPNWNSNANPSQPNWSSSGGNMGGMTGPGPRESAPGPGSSYPREPERVPFGRRKKRQISISFEPLESLYAATLAGDIGQAAILNARFQNVQNKPPPSGTWNDTICPREYTLNALPYNNEEISRATDTWTYMTAAEVRGGLDGAILGGKIAEWDRLNVLKLSQVLEMYYSDNGFASEPMYRACDRSNLWGSVMPTTKLLEQAKSFAYLYNSEVKEMAINSDETVNAFLDSVNIAYNRLSSFAGSLGGVDPNCARRPTSSGGSVEIPDREKYTVPKTTVYAILDHSVSMDALRAQYRFLGQLAHELDVSVRGSRLGVVDGRGGQLLISPNWTDNAAVLACRIVDQQPFAQSQDLLTTLRAVQTELQRVRDIEHRTEYNIGVGNGIVILIFAQNRIDESRAGDVKYLLEEIDYEFGDVHTIYTSSILNEADFDSLFLNDPSYDFIRIRGSQNISDDADEFVEEFKKKTHGRLYYPRCNQIDYDQFDEYKIANDIWISPGQIQYYKISPNYFFSNKDLRLRFTSDRGRVRICFARSERFPSSINENDGDAWCEETTGSYQAPGGSVKADIEFAIKKPCDKERRRGCDPIYISIAPTVVNTGGAAGVDCSTYGCETPDQVRVTWSHWNMRCGAFRTTFSSLTAFLATLLSIFTFYKSF